MLSKSEGHAHEEKISSVQLLGAIDISVTKDSSPVQPRNIKFPLQLIGKQYRAFTVSLNDKYPWIEYSQSKDAIFWYYCRHFAKDRKEPAFIREGFRNWKKCYGTKRGDNKLLQHNASFQHSECVDAHAHYIAVKTGTFQSVVELQGSARAKLVKENRQYMCTVCQVLLVTA